MSSIHETRAVSCLVDTALVSPVFLPLADLTAGTQLIPSQCTLTITGTPSPLECAVQLCTPGTVLGDPGPAVLQTGPRLVAADGEAFTLTGSVPPIDAGGVLGLAIPTQGAPAGAKVKGVLSLVR
jgi:hypothetical protein